MPLLRFSRRGTILLLKQVRTQLPSRHKPLRGLFDTLGQCRGGLPALMDQQGHPRLRHTEVLRHLLDRSDRLFVKVLFEVHPSSLLELFIQHNVDSVFELWSTAFTPKRRSLKG